jgi:protein tyrosine phosphatase (PTP) superfamily phosphohydrolase (DUF442 family)
MVHLLSNASACVPARRWLRALVWLGAVVLAGYVVREGWRTFGGSNVHVLIPGRVYRSAQQNGPDLESFIRRHGIRTVINLRGYSAPLPFYLDEARAAHRLNISLEDVSMSAGRFPSTHELHYLLNVLDRCEYPILIHCKQGADRTGLISAFILLLQTDTDLAQARRQLSPLYGHIPLGRPANLDRYLGLYEGWLEKAGRSHSPAALREWLTQPGGTGEYRAAWEPLDFPKQVPAGRPVALHVRAINRGHRAWKLQAESNSGIHAYYCVRNPEGAAIHAGRAGMFDASVNPDASIDLTLALPAFHEPGRYHLFVDLLDEAHCTFVQTGAEPLEWDFEVIAG